MDHYRAVGPGGRAPRRTMPRARATGASAKWSCGFTRPAARRDHRVRDRRARRLLDNEHDLVQHRGYPVSALAERLLAGKATSRGYRTAGRQDAPLPWRRRWQSENEPLYGPRTQASRCRATTSRLHARTLPHAYASQNSRPFQLQGPRRKVARRPPAAIGSLKVRPLRDSKRRVRDRYRRAMQHSPFRGSRRSRHRRSSPQGRRSSPGPMRTAS